MSRVLVIGWDGADWRILDPLLERGALPNLAALIERGGRGVLKSTLPTHSWTAWPSFLTGVDPADHGVYDILESRGGVRQQFPVTFRSIRERTFLADLTAGRASRRVMVNVPLTFPPPEISGKLVAGGVLPKWRPFTHPESLADGARGGRRPVADQRDVVDDVPQPAGRRSSTRWNTFAGRGSGPWSTCSTPPTGGWPRASYFATDRIQHCLAKYLSPDHPDYARALAEPLAERIRDVYRLLDEGLGRWSRGPGPDDLVVFMSDHGFQSCTGAVNMDRLLERLGLPRVLGVEGHLRARCNGGRCGRWPGRCTTRSGCTAGSRCRSP